MSLDEEVSLLVMHRPTIETLERHFDDDLRYCEPIMLRRWRARDRATRMKQRLAHLLRRQV